MTKKKLLIAIPVVILCLAAVAAFLNRGQSLSTVSSERGSITGTITETGTVCGGEEKRYYAAVSATVESFDLKEGDVVKEGDELLTYDLSKLEYEYSRAALMCEQSEDAYNASLKKSEENRARYEEAKNEDAAYGAVYAQVRNARDSILEQQYGDDYYTRCMVDGINRRASEKKEEILDKTQELNRVLDRITEYTAKEKKVPKSTRKKKKKLQQELDDLNDELYDLDTLAASYYTGGLDPEDYSKNDIYAGLMEDINREWEEAKNRKQYYETAFLNEDEKSSMEKEVQAARECEAEARRILGRGECGIHADFDGVVTSCAVKKDAFVTEGSELFSIESTDTIKVKLDVSRFDVGRIREGQEALIKAADKSYKGKVSRISSHAVTDQADKSRIEVEVTVLEPDEGLILGARCDVTVFTEKSENTVLIPVEACYSDDGGDCCYVIKNDRVCKKYFEKGITNEDYVQAVSGIEKGELLITDAVTDDMIGQRAVGRQEKTGS